MKDEPEINWLELADEILRKQPRPDDLETSPDSRGNGGVHPAHLDSSEVSETLKNALSSVPSASAMPDHDVQALWERHQKRLAGLDSQPSSGQNWGSMTARFRSLPFLSALTLLIIGIVSYPYIGNIFSSGSAGSSSVYVTTAAQQRIVVLPDSSQVLLNPESRLVLSGAFGSTDRNVHLVGEALFTVTHNTGVPFTVSSGDLVTRVLGTEFVVRNYPEDTSTIVAVKSGRISVEAPRSLEDASSSILIPTQQAEYSRSGRFAVSAAAPYRFAFASNQLVFDGTLTRDAIPELHRWYGVKFDIQDESILNIPLRLTLTGHDVSRATELLGLILGSEPVQVNDTLITITPKSKR